MFQRLLPFDDLPLHLCELYYGSPAVAAVSAVATGEKTATRPGWCQLDTIEALSGTEWDR